MERIDKAEMNELFRSGDHARISLALYEVARIVAKSVRRPEGLGENDLTNDIYVHLSKQQRKYRP